MSTGPGITFRPRRIGLASLYAGLAIFVFFLAFCDLDGRLFWTDEAETAILARNVLKFGAPKVDDGVNHISLHGDQFDARNGIWTWSPWLPDYLTAASFVVFGQTTWAGRAPFAFIGWCAVLLLGYTAWKIYQSHWIAISSMLLLGTSELFLLHIRQCRYYSITIFAEIFIIYGIYLALTQSPRGAWWVLSGLLLQFYCNYTVAAANLPLLLLLTIQWLLQKNKAAVPMLAALGAFLLLCVPWLLYTEVWRQSSAEVRAPWASMLYFYFQQLDFCFLPWCFLLLPLGAWASHRFRKGAHVPPACAVRMPGLEKNYSCSSSCTCRYCCSCPVITRDTSCRFCP